MVFEVSLKKMHGLPFGEQPRLGWGKFNQGEDVVTLARVLLVQGGTGLDCLQFVDWSDAAKAAMVKVVAAIAARASALCDDRNMEGFCGKLQKALADGDKIDNALVVSASARAAWIRISEIEPSAQDERRKFYKKIHAAKAIENAIYSAFTLASDERRGWRIADSLVGTFQSATVAAGWAGILEAECAAQIRDLEAA